MGKTLPQPDAAICLEEVVFAWASLDARLTDLVAHHADLPAHDMRGMSALYAQLQCAGQIGSLMLMHNALPMENWMPATDSHDQPFYTTPVDVMQYLIDALRNQRETVEKAGMDIDSIAMQLAIMKGRNNQEKEELSAKAGKELDW